MNVGFRNLSIALLLLLAAGVTSALHTTITEPPVSELLLHFVKIDDVEIAVEFADTPALRTKGLSGRELLEEGRGMLFIFENAGRYDFWMKDMHFPIDIIWISSDKKVVGITPSLSPETFPEVYYPPTDVPYVLEVPSGYAATHGLKEGDQLTW
ncbi:hypothetical protein A2671_01145 [Candidatus Kaiserbacteria bacterium RIFCSPHIGHO2_01_FULL_49_13]|uniref:DUF192 domain-containing protein n=1 Tax=Candidatus Kaiserbacteria bacterium RIFCSPHIGHO2_01_FULL_49_13 TaxID=1798477 RepID=A0A1F6CDW6_9BACT|nr:MAG: hypothetical protein A2671_01145 [Candidatus Kaiserbacteria bacterium RIFCSPHIGHO2_01_FULL_49_13]